MYSKIVSACTKSCKVFLGPKVKNRAKEWIKPDTWEAVDARRTMKKLTNGKSERMQDKLRQQYKKANKEVKKIVRADKRFYANNLTTQAEEAAAKEELGQI